MSSIYDRKYRIAIECLKAFRIQSKMTQQELACNLNCSQAYISKYEQGQKRLDIIEVRDICACLGVSLPEFVDEFERQIKKEGI